MIQILYIKLNFVWLRDASEEIKLVLEIKNIKIENLQFDLEINLVPAWGDLLYESSQR